MMASTSSSINKNNNRAGWSSVLTTLALLVTPAVAKYTCHQDLGKYYPYCVNVPDNIKDGETLPTIVFLSGSGARGPASNVKSLSGYDGFGRLINQYLGGNKGADQTMAAEQFVTIIPISPENDNGPVRHWWPEYLDDVYADVKKNDYPVDWSHLHLSGYSMGARGCWRNAVANPSLYASISPSAGAAEKAGDGTLSQQKAPEVWSQLDKIKNLPVMQFGGENDNTAGITAPRATEAELKKIGSSVAQLVVEPTDHSGMSTKPFNVKLMQWMLEQGPAGSSTGGSSSTPSSSADDSEDDDSTSTPTKSDSAEGSQGTIAPSKSSSSSSSSSTGGNSSVSPSRGASVKCKRSRKAKRSSGSETFLARPGPVRRGIYDAAGASANQIVKRGGLTLAAIVQHQDTNRQGATPAKKEVKRSPLESMKMHANNARAQGNHHVPNMKLGRRGSR